MRRSFTQELRFKIENPKDCVKKILEVISEDLRENDVPHLSTASQLISAVGMNV